MGLFSDPKTRNKIAGLIARYNNKLCLLCYLAGFIWFLALAYVQVNARTYFSENALLPGLVDSDLQHGHGSAEFFQDLKALVKKKKSDEEDMRMPVDWLIQKFSELGLEAYAHNYSFKYPFNILNGQVQTGQNMYAILRARRASSTEAVILCAPYRESHDNTLAGIALMFGLANAFKRNSYWAKDIIFLVTDNEEIGIQAWLSAYHHTYSSYILPGELQGRSGSIQAAINLEIGTDLINRMDIRIEGLNGQLPNLDLVNTVIRLCRREGLPPTLHKRTDYWNPDSWDGFEHSAKTMFLMMWHQAPGMPTGNHGLFHRYNIEAVTLHGVKLKNSKQNLGFPEMGRVIEGIFRSLNNLLERFHQSFFFYLLPSTDRYVSIGLYMPPFGLLVLPVAIKAIALWLSTGVLSKVDEGPAAGDGVKPPADPVNDDKAAKDEKKNDCQSETDDAAGTTKETSQTFLQMLCYIPYFLMALFFGFGAFYGPGHFITTAISMHLSPEAGITIGFLAVHVAVIFYPVLQKWKKSKDPSFIGNAIDARLLKCISLLALGITLTTTAVINISLAFFVAAFWVPVVLFIQPSNSRLWHCIQFLFLVIISPFGLMCIAAAINQLFLKKSSPEDFLSFVTYAWEDIQNTLLLIAIQGQMFGNLSYGLMCLALLPIWILFRLIPSCDVAK